MKKNFLLTIIIFFISIGSTYGHVTHYKKVKFLKYGLFLNDKLIGNHSFNFKISDNLFYVKTKGSFKVDKLGVVLMNYQTDSEEVYKKNMLIKYISNTLQNDKKKFVKISLIENNKLFVDGSSFKGVTEHNSIIGSWWNHEIVKNSKQISPISGRIIKQKVNFLGKESIDINGNKFEALHFHFLSDDDKPLNKKKLNMHVWYDTKTLLWLKASYNKFGNWEYRLLESR